MDQHTAPAQAAQITIDRGNPTAEELAAVTALLSALGSGHQHVPETAPTAARLTRLRKRRALTTPRLSWNLGRR